MNNKILFILIIICQDERCRRGVTGWDVCCERVINLILHEHYHTNVGVCLVDTKADRACDVYSSNKIMGVRTNACRYAHGDFNDRIDTIAVVKPRWDDLYGNYGWDQSTCGRNPKKKN